MHTGDKSRWDLTMSTLKWPGIDAATNPDTPDASLDEGRSIDETLPAKIPGPKGLRVKEFRSCVVIDARVSQVGASHLYTLTHA